MLIVDRQPSKQEVSGHGGSSYGVILVTIAGGVVHAYVDQKLIKSNKIKSFNQ
jgi:hypothetical protein